MVPAIVLPAPFLYLKKAACLINQEVQARAEKALVLVLVLVRILLAVFMLIQ